MAAQVEISTRCKRTIQIATRTNSQMLRQNRGPGDVRRKCRIAHDSPAAWITTHRAIRQEAASSLPIIPDASTPHEQKQGPYPRRIRGANAWKSRDSKVLDGIGTRGAGRA